jgi:hypothetical protein
MDKIKPETLTMLSEAYSSTFTVRTLIAEELERASKQDDLEHVILTKEDAEVLIAILEDAQTQMLAAGSIVRRAIEDQEKPQFHSGIFLPRTYN